MPVVQQDRATVAPALAAAALRLSSERRALAGVGVATGAAAALLLVAALGATVLDRPARLDGPSVTATAVPTVPVRAELAGAVSTLAYLLSQARAADGGWPASIAVTADGRVYATSGPNVGHLLLRTPVGTTLDYAVSDDGGRMALTLSAEGDPAATVRYSSTTGLSTNE